MFRSPHHREFWSHTNRRISWITLGLVVLSSADAFAWWWLYKQTGFATKWWSQCLENQPWLGQKWLENAWKRLNHPIWDLPMKGMKKWSWWDLPRYYQIWTVSTTFRWNGNGWWLGLPLVSPETTLVFKFPIVLVFLSFQVASHIVVQVRWNSGGRPKTW